MDNNRSRIFAEALSVDAWHDPFRIDGSTSAVYVELSFQQGRLGGADPKIPFTFRVSLKRALLTIKVEQPLSIQTSSIARDIPQVPAELSRILAAKHVAKKNRLVKGSVNPATFSLGMSGSVGAESEASREDQLKVVQQVPRILVSSRPRSAQEYAWQLEPSYENYLEGQPWDPAEGPRLRVRHPSAKARIDPMIKISLSCALEDLEIDDLEPKPSSLLESLKQELFGEVSYASAVHYLKQVLVNSDLDVGRVDNRFSDLWLADVVSKEEFPGDH